MNEKVFSVGANIRRVRETLGYSCIEVARGASIEVGELHLIEAGSLEPSGRTVDAIAYVLRVKTSEFFVTIPDGYWDKGKPYLLGWARTKGLRESVCFDGQFGYGHFVFNRDKTKHVLFATSEYTYFSFGNRETLVSRTEPITSSAIERAKTFLSEE